jgi:molecular chaperone DnaK (HSP70)
VTERIGIDFGAANTVVARWDADAGRGEPVPLDGIDMTREAGEGVTQRVVPSLIAFSHDSAQRWVGARAAPLLTDPGVSVFQSAKAAVTGRTVDIARRVGTRKITAREAATQFLGDVTALAVLTVGADDLEIVATAPVETFDAYRDWLVREVGAGLADTRLRVVDEATAAAVGYRARMSPGDVFCVFDFGAGTLDVSVVRVTHPDAEADRAGSGVRTIAKAGLDLGGRHIDGLLAEWAAGTAGLPQGDAVAYNRVFARLLVSAEAAKVALTRRASAVVEAADPETGTRYRADVSRAQFERLLRDKDVLGRAARGLRKALDDAAAHGYPSGEIAGVFLVGGSSLIPAVQDLVRMQFDPSIVHQERPLEAVAAGAAAIAGGQELHDHIQHDYAIRHVAARSGSYEFEILVAAGTAYPTPEPVKSLTIQAIHPGQRRMGLAIYELAHATYRDASADLEIVFDADGGARAIPVSPQQRQEQAMLWLNEESPTFLEADPPAGPGADRFRLDFRIDAGKRLVVSAFDLKRRIWVLDRQPVVRLALPKGRTPCHTSPAFAPP